VSGERNWVSQNFLGGQTSNMLARDAFISKCTHITGVEWHSAPGSTTPEQLKSTCRSLGAPASSFISGVTRTGTYAQTWSSRSRGTERWCGSHDKQECKSGPHRETDRHGNFQPNSAVATFLLQTQKHTTHVVQGDMNLLVVGYVRKKLLWLFPAFPLLDVPHFHVLCMEFIPLASSVPSVHGVGGRLRHY